MKTTKEKADIMIAFVEGKTIQYSSDGATWYDINIKDGEEVWDWSYSDFRIKPEPTYRPYKNFDEFRADWEKHGGWAKDDRDCSYTMLCSFECAIAECLNVHFTWADDGTPCGIKEE